MTETFRPDYLLPGTRIGNYTIHQLLGVGSSGVVYEVRSREDNRFAMKVSRFRPGEPSSRDTLMDRRFSRSVLCLAELRGVKNVAQLYAHDRYPDPLNGWQFLVQELVPGSESLLAWARRTSPTLRELAGVLTQLASALGEMAHADIRHRDLKPSNILMAPGGVPKIIDFDSATCFRAEDLTGPLPSSIPGTLAYLSPEHCAAILKERSGEPAPLFLYLPTNDLHALGVIFYELFTGRHPFAAASQTEEALLRRIAHHEPARPRELNPQLPFLLEDAVMYLLKKDPKLRCQHGDDFVKWLARGVANVAHETWDVPLRVGEPAPLAPALVETPARARSSGEASPASAQVEVVQRGCPRAWLAAGAAALAVAAVLLVGTPRGAGQPGTEAAAGVPLFEEHVPARVDPDADISGVPSFARAPAEALAGAADAATLASELVLRATLIKGPLPGQKVAPCDKQKHELKYKGACWRLIYTQGSCDRADIYEPEVGYCKKHKHIYEPVYVEKKAKKPGSVVEPISPDVPILEDGQP